MFKVNNRSNRRHSGAFIVNFYIVDTFLLFFAEFEHINA